MADDELSETESTFMEHFRRRMSESEFGWLPGVAPDDWYAEMDLTAPEGRCLVWTDVIHGNVVVDVVGAYLSDTVTTIGVLHHQLFFIDHTRPLLQQFQGSVDEQARATADWFIELKRRQPQNEFSESETAH